MRILIRADATQTIGSGHIMRCLSLAESLREGGARIVFACRQLPPHLTALIKTAGHEICLLTAKGEADDAAETLAHLDGIDWVVVDHYGLGAAWERVVRRHAPVMAIDDLQRDHECDILLDQNYDPVGSKRYQGRVPVDCRVLVGLDYALLRSEFLRQRKTIAARHGAVQRVVVFLSGMDADDITSNVLAALDRAGTDGLSVDVVIGATHGSRDDIIAFCADRPGFSCHIQTHDMARLLAQADMAIGAGGSATWERACMGTPTLALCIADNQRKVLQLAAAAGIVYAPDIVPSDVEGIALHIRAMLANSGLRAHISATALGLVDGRGANRVAALLLANMIALRPATLEHSADLHRWRNHEIIRTASIHVAPISWNEHQGWMDGILEDSARRLLVGYHGDVPIGVIRFDMNDDSSTISIYLVPEKLGLGLGDSLLAASERWLRNNHREIRHLKADIRSENAVSKTLFERHGYTARLTHYSKEL